jgi:hypothetical protein
MRHKEREEKRRKKKEKAMERKKKQIGKESKEQKVTTKGQLLTEADRKMLEHWKKMMPKCEEKETEAAKNPEDSQHSVDSRSSFSQYREVIENSSHSPGSISVSTSFGDHSVNSPNDSLSPQSKHNGDNQSEFLSESVSVPSTSSCQPIYSPISPTDAKAQKLPFTEYNSYIPTFSTVASLVSIEDTSQFLSSGVSTLTKSLSFVTTASNKVSDSASLMSSSFSLASDRGTSAIPTDSSQPLLAAVQSHTPLPSIVQSFYRKPDQPVPTSDLHYPSSQHSFSEPHTDSKLGMTKAPETINEDRPSLTDPLISSCIPEISLSQDAVDGSSMESLTRLLSRSAKVDDEHPGTLELTPRGDGSGYGVEGVHPGSFEDFINQNLLTSGVSPFPSAESKLLDGWLDLQQELAASHQGNQVEISFLEHELNLLSNIKVNKAE